MAKNVWQKRRMKLAGVANQVASAAMLRYTPLNTEWLRSEIKKNGIDRLHVGCGDVILPGWLNIRYEIREAYGFLKKENGGWVLNFNLLKPWPVDPESVLFVAGSHFIEHLDLNNGMKFVEGAYRSLKKGGRIRLSCPDMERYAVNYVNRNKDFFNHPKIREWCAFKNAATPGEIFVAKAYDSGGAHKWFYDFDSLKHILENSGFRDVKRCERLEGLMPDIPSIEPPGRELETVYVEAVK